MAACKRNTGVSTGECEHTHTACHASYRPGAVAVEALHCDAKQVAPLGPPDREVACRDHHAFGIRITRAVERHSDTTASG